MALPTPQTVIDSVLAVYDGVDAFDADNIQRRANLLLYLQHIHDYVWNLREWEWTFVETSLTVTAGNNYTLLPLDPAAPPCWLEFGRNGGLWGPNQKRWTEVSKYTLERIRNESTTAADAGVFAVAGGAIQLPAAVSANLVLTAFHRFAPPVLVDAPEPAPPDTYAFIIPPRYVNTVLIPGLVFKAQESKRDARGGFGAQFQDGIAQMCALENPMKTGVHKMPRSVPGMW